MSYRPNLSGRAVIWLDQGWQPAYIGFCPTRAAWAREMRRLGVKNEPWPEAAASTHTFDSKGKACIIVAMRPEAEKGSSRVQLAGLIAHEAVHVWQFVKRHIGEREPGWEMEAYSIQAIFQNLYRAWFDVRGYMLPADERSKP